MRRVSIVLILCLLSLASASIDGAAQRLTSARRIHGKDARGRYDIEWVRLAERFPNAAVRARVNTDLEKEARSHICEANSGRFLDAWYQMKVTYLSPRVLAVSTAEFTACGWPNPVHGTRALLYDLGTGARMEVETETVDPRAFRRFVARRALAARPEDAGECADEYTSEALRSTGYIYLMDDEGLEAIQDYPNVIMACGYDTRIPYADLLPFLKPASPLRTLADPNPWRSLR